MSQKQHYISYENQHFFQPLLKIQQPVVEFFKNVNFQRRYDAFSETPGTDNCVTLCTSIMQYHKPNN